MPRDPGAISDMLDAPDRIGRHVSGMDYETLPDDARTHDAVARRIEIRRESAKRLWPSVRDRHRANPRRDIAGMRERVIHGYDTVQVALAWETAPRDVPRLHQ